jgi:cobalamin biosynthesis protein CobD/CbiB
MKKNIQSKSNVQIVWGAALILVGVAVFFRIPQVIPQLVQMGQSAATVLFVRISFYLMGILLVGGGVKKIVRSVRQQDSISDERPPSEGENDLNR